MTKTKPWINVATCCEKVLMEEDGVASLIRIVDTYSIHEPPRAVAASSLIQVGVFISLRSEEATQESQVSLVLEGPDGARKPFPEKIPIILAGGGKGANLQVNLNVSAQKVGVYWIEVLWDDELLTKVPFKLLVAE